MVEVETAPAMDVPQDNRKPRSLPNHCKFHCVMHKGEEGKFCFSHSCMSLKKLSFEERIKLLKENGDCSKCCGDCPPNKCKCSSPHVCGGEKEGMGYGKTHEIHKLFCKEAKLCFHAISSTVIKTEASLKLSGEEEEELCSRL